MKLKLCWIVMTIVLLGSPHYAGATPVLEETGFIFGFSGETFSFVADQTPLVYMVTLTDFEFPTAFDFLGVAITTSTEKVAELLAPGMTTFDVEFGKTYFANVLGDAADSSGAGLFGISVVPVPEPDTLALLAMGFAGLAQVSRRRRPAQPGGCFRLRRSSFAVRMSASVATRFSRRSDSISSAV
jgi:hypothetical protein